MPLRRALGVLAFAAVLWPEVSFAANLTLAWDPPTDGVTTGYMIYVGTASQSYTQEINVGFVTSYVVTGLSAGVTYYFAVRAYDTSGALSAASNEVSGMVGSGGASGQTLFGTQVPSGLNFQTGSTWELGTRFRSSVAGHITAIRFWKGSAEVGPHVGRLWTAGGAQLAAVTFTNESVSGWQEQDLPTPVAISANVEYVVSVSTGPTGHYSATSGFFSTALINGELTGPAGANGLYASPPGAFPTQSYQNTSFFRDIVFVPSGGAGDQVAPVVQLTAPPSGGTVSGQVTLLATATDNVGVAGVQFQVDGQNVGAEDTMSPYSVTWNTMLATNGSHQVTAVARDAAGNVATTSVTVIVNNGGGSGQTLLTTQLPAGQFGGDYELGVRVIADVAGQVTALRFWKGNGDTGTHIGRLWTASGTLLASVTFVNETSSGWQQQSLATPLSIAANTEYVVSVTNGGTYPATVGFFATPLVNGHLRAPAGGNGLYGAPGAFPMTPYQDANYFRDLVFVPGGPAPDTTAPVAQITAPANGGTLSGQTTLQATATDNVGVAGVRFQVDGQNLGVEDTTAPYSVTWDTTTASNGSHQITAIARDDAGNTTSTSVTVTVNNGGTAQTLLTSQLPAGQFTGDYELGVRVIASVAGQVTALRFWKGAGDAAPHVGRVWTSTGILLASVTFANETASGWQQQALVTPLAIAANVEYVVSVTTGGTYPATVGFFSTPLANGNLRAPAGGNGLYGAPGTFPATAYQDANYFRDLVFVAGGTPPDTTSPVVQITAPANGGTVSGQTTLQATATDNVGVAGVRFQVDGQNVGVEDTAAPYTVAWDTLLSPNGSHQITAIARDAAGNIATTSITVTVNNGGTPQTLLTSQLPAGQFGGNYELGVRIIADVAGHVTALRFWKGAGDTGPHVGRIWSATGTLLASVTFDNETTSGWQQQMLDAPLPLSANTEYVISVTTGGAYPATVGFFSAPLVNNHLRAPAGGGLYGAPGTFPTTAYQDANYFRDLVFVPNGAPVALILAESPETNVKVMKK